MLRRAASRPISRGLNSVISARFGDSFAQNRAGLSSHFHSLAAKRPQVVIQPVRPVVVPQLRYVTKTGVPKFDTIDTAAEEKLKGEKLGRNPDAVTKDSSVRTVIEPSKAKPEEEHEILGGIKQDFRTIRDSFALSDVPRESYYLGAAGTLPHLATSIATVYLSYGLNHAPATGSSIFFSAETAHQYLEILEPIQIGFGAVILSFLGAIHWGLEWAGYGGYQGYRRFAIGVAMPAIAWPTMLMPLEYALITQFAAFTGLYFVDARQGMLGFAPPWYPTYRFVLTFIVGISIVVSLIGRGQVQHEHRNVLVTADKLKALADSQPEAQREEERVKVDRRAAVSANNKEKE